MKPSIALALPLLAPIFTLAACHSQPSVSADNASMSEVQTKVAAATGNSQLISPGRWEATATVHAMTIPGLPPAAQAELAKRQNTPHTSVSCITPEQIKANKAFMAGSDMDKACKYDHFSMSGGKIDATMSCNRDGATSTATMSGTYAPDTYHMDMTTKAQPPAGSPTGAMTMSVSVDAKRVGACRGGEDKPVMPGEGVAPK
jgi:hypothetical protein